MKKFLSLFVLLTFTAAAQAYTPTNIAGFTTLSQLQVVISPLGSKKPVPINLSSGDVTITAPIRLITATAGTVIYVDITAPDGKASNVPIPPNLPVVNITKIYKTGTDCMNIMVWPLELK
jgi:hypothetical protein